MPVPGTVFHEIDQQTQSLPHWRVKKYYTRWKREHLAKNIYLDKHLWPYLSENTQFTKQPDRQGGLGFKEIQDRIEFPVQENFYAVISVFPILNMKTFLELRIPLQRLGIQVSNPQLMLIRDPSHTQFHCCY